MGTDTNAAKLSYQVSPIFLTGGTISQATVGGMLPFLMIIAPQLFPQLSNINAISPLPTQLGPEGPATQFSPISLQIPLDFNIDDLGAFSVLPGGTLVKQDVAKYPFANQWVAANATIREPLTLSLIWDTPMRTKEAWNTKFINMTKVKAILDMHNNFGGTYTVVTPAGMFQNMILIGVSDASRPTSPIPQNAWRFDFEKPLIAVADLLAAENQLFAKVTGGLPTDGNWTGAPLGLGSLTSMPNFGGPSLLPVLSAMGMFSGLPSGGIGGRVTE